MRIILIILLTAQVVMLKAQHLAIYNDYLDKVQLFNAGNFEEIEHLPLKSYQIGNNAVAYEDNSGSFKVYYNQYLYLSLPAI